MAETNQNQTGGMFDNKSGAQSAPAQQPQQNLSIVQKDVVDTVLSKIKDFEEAGELKLPTNYSAANALKSAWLILQETKDRNDKPALVVCTKESVANALLDMVVQGLSPMKSSATLLYMVANLLCNVATLEPLPSPNVWAVLKLPLPIAYMKGMNLYSLLIRRPGLKRLSNMSRLWKVWMQTRLKGLMLFSRPRTDGVLLRL